MNSSNNLPEGPELVPEDEIAPPPVMNTWPGLYALLLGALAVEIGLFYLIRILLEWK